MGRWAIVNGVLVALVLLLGLQIYFTWDRSLPTIEVSARQPESSSPGEGKPEGKSGGSRRGKRGPAEKQEQPAQLVAMIVDKDLFDASRQRPTEEVKAPPPKEIGPPPNLTLVGVRMIGRDREALVTDAAQGNQQRRLRIGDEIGGYTLKGIRPSRVTLASAAGETLTLTLSLEKAGGAGAPRPPGAPGTPGAPARPGQPALPPGGVPSPAAGVQPAAAVAVPPSVGTQPRQPRAAMPRRPGVPPQAAAPGVAPPPAAGVAPTGVQAVAPPNPNLPAAVREKLEQLRGN